MNRPLIVYLDTQDYSKLSDCENGRGHAQLTSTFEALLRFVESGQIICPYSDVVIAELLQFDDSSLDLMIRKASTLRRLSLGWCFLHSPKTLGFQIATAATGGADLPLIWGAPLSNENNWFPRLDRLLEGLDFRAMKRNAVHELATEHGLNRKARRAAQSKFRNMTAAAMGPTDFSSLKEKYPFSDHLYENVLPRYFDGQMSREAAEAVILPEMGEPVNFAHWYYTAADSKKTLNEWVRGPGEILLEHADRVRNLSATWPDVPDGQKIVDGAFADMGFKLCRPMGHTARSEYVLHGCTDEQFNALCDDRSRALGVPFFNTLISLFPAYFSHLNPFLGSPRTAKRSDYADILHSLFLPYCDLWRGDGYFSSLLKSVAQTDSSKVVPKLEHLPNEIEKLLRQMAKSADQA